MPRPLPPLEAAWDDAVERYASLGPGDSLAAYNVALLQALRHDWVERVRVSTSMFDLIFNRPGEHWFDSSESEWVRIRLMDGERVRMELVRRVPRRSLDRPGGTVVMAGDVTEPENVMPALEALLLQLTDPNDL